MVSLIAVVCRFEWARFIKSEIFRLIVGQFSQPSIELRQM